MWPEPFNIFYIRLTFQIHLKLFDIFHCRRVNIKLYFFNAYCNFIFVKIFTHIKIISESKLHLICKRIKYIIILNYYFLIENIIHHT